MRLRSSFALTRAAGHLALLVFVAPACFEDGAGLILPDLDATLVGRVEATLAPPAGSALPQSAAEADSVVAVSVGASGQVTTLVAAAVSADGAYRLEDVPADRTRIQVVARGADGSEVGRAPLFAETVADTEHAVAPIVPETTVQGRVLVQLRTSGATEAADDPGSLVLLVRMSDAEASFVTRSTTEVGAVAEAFLAGRAHLAAGAVAVAPAVTDVARAELMAELALDWTEARHAGTSPGEAHDALAAATLDGWAELGADPQALALLTAARARGVAQGSAAGGDATRLAVLRQATSLNLRARERRAATASGAPGSSAETVTARVVAARAEVEASTSIAELTAALDALAADAGAAVLDALLGAAGELDEAVREQVETTFAVALADADLSARLAATASVEEAAQALADYPAAVDAAATAVIALVPQAELDAGALVALLIAVGAGGAGPTAG